MLLFSRSFAVWIGSHRLATVSLDLEYDGYCCCFLPQVFTFSLRNDAHSCISDNVMGTQFAIKYAQYARKCTKYSKISKKYAKYAKNMHNMQSVCKKYAKNMQRAKPISSTFNMQKMQKKCKKCKKNCKICSLVKYDTKMQNHSMHPGFC